MVITLIGYRGTGKSTIAAPLATRLGWEWIDADAELENRDGQSISDMFVTQGEAYFRKLERDIIAELLRRDSLVIAAGGGSILNPQTREEMKSAGPVIWLQASIDTIERRIGGDAKTAKRRPDLTASGGRDEIIQLLNQREPLYRECATVEFNTDDASADEIVDRILQSIASILTRET